MRLTGASLARMAAGLWVLAGAALAALPAEAAGAAPDGAMEASAGTAPGSSPTKADAEAALAALPLPPASKPPTEADLIEPPHRPRGRSLYLALVRAEAERQGLPPEVADAVVMVESAYNPNAIGGVGEVGLMQVRPTTAAMLGFRGPVTGLFEPQTNIRYGVTYLAGAWRLSGGQLCEALMRYRSGHGETRMTPLSIEYCRRARTHLAAVGSPHGAAPLPPIRPAAGEGLARIGRPATGVRPAKIAAGRPGASSARRAMWAAHEARLRAIEARVKPTALTIMQ